MMKFSAFSVPMGPFLTRNILSVTGGLMWTALKLRISTLSMMKLLLSERLTPQVLDSMEEIMGDKVDKEDIKDQEEEDQDQVDPPGIGMDHQDILELLQLLTMITLLHLGLVQEAVILLLAVLDQAMVLPVVLILGTLLPLELALGMEHLQEQGQGTLLLTRPLQGYSLPDTGVVGGEEGDTAGSKIFLL